MSSSGGIGGGGGSPVIPTNLPAAGGDGAVSADSVTPDGQPVTIGGVQVSAEGMVSVDGQNLDIGTPEGTAALLQAVNAEEFDSVMGLMQLKQVDGPDGPILVPNDRFETTDTAALQAILGPMDMSEGFNASDEEINAQMMANGSPNVLHSGSLTQTNAGIVENGTLAAGSAKLTNLIANPTQQNIDGFAEYMLKVESEGGNIMEVLFLCFKESIKETNEDKKYFLVKLQEYNKMGEALGDYLSELADVSRHLNEVSAGQKYPEMVLVSATIRKFDTSGLDKSGNMVETSTHVQKVGSSSLNTTIKEVEGMQETVRNKRQMASTAFQSFDQKANQLYNLLSSVMKAMNEMRMGTTRNML